LASDGKLEKNPKQLIDCNNADSHQKGQDCVERGFCLPQIDFSYLQTDNDGDVDKRHENHSDSALAVIAEPFLILMFDTLPFDIFRLWSQANLQLVVL
jgi:hypothetical protein